MRTKKHRVPETYYINIDYANFVKSFRSFFNFPCSIMYTEGNQKMETKPKIVETAVNNNIIAGLELDLRIRNIKFC